MEEERQPFVDRILGRGDLDGDAERGRLYVLFVMIGLNNYLV